MFCEVERSYIEDGFNLYGLRGCVANFSDCLDLILDRIGPDDSDDSHLTQSACTLYGLIHARYIITSHGLDGMYNKYVNKDFGTCPLLQCYNQPVLPVGLQDEMGSDTVKIFCPKCQCVYQPPPIRSRSHSLDDIGSASVDGAAFGTTFPHLFLMTFHNLVPEGLTPDTSYVPRVFGFRVHKTAKSRNDAVSVHAKADLATQSAAAAVSAARSTTSAAASTVNANVNANDESSSKPLGQDLQRDNTAATSAIPIATNNDTNNQTNSSSKGLGSTINKIGAKVKSEDSAASGKRKGKSSNGSNGNGSNGDAERKEKRQKRESSSVKT